MSETSGMRTVDYVPQSIGYRQSHAICRRTYGKETKAKPTIRIYLHIMLTGDTLNRSAVKRRLWLLSLKILHGYGAFVVVRGQ